MGNDRSQADCAVEAFEQAVARAREHVSRAYALPGEWSARVRRALTALLRLLDGEPALARLLFLQPSDSDPRTAERRAELLAELVAALESSVGRPDRAAHRHGGQTGNDAAGVWSGASDMGVESAFDAEDVVGAAISLLERRVRSEPDAPLLELVNPLMAMLVLPHCDRTATARELAEPGGVSASVSVYGLRPAV